MAQGRGSAGQAKALVVALLCLVSAFHICESATYYVGDNGGWSFNTVAWPNGKRFRAGDLLIFKYDSSSHDMVKVDAAGYNRCSLPRGAKRYASGNDRVTLTKGKNYFICSFPGHCQAGMKIAVTAM